MKGGNGHSACSITPTRIVSVRCHCYTVVNGRQPDRTNHPAEMGNVYSLAPLSTPRFEASSNSIRPPDDRASIDPYRSIVVYPQELTFGNMVVTKRAPPFKGCGSVGKQTSSGAPPAEREDSGIRRRSSSAVRSRAIEPSIPRCTSAASDLMGEPDSTDDSSGSA